jgi:CPA2 family monovalent cation:H+ antiporter-2
MLAGDFPLAGRHRAGRHPAMSSTALVVKLLAERMQLNSKHGREIIGVLLFQDLAVVPLLILVPALSQCPRRLAGTLAVAALKAAVVLR